MIRIQLASHTDFGAWRDAARRLCAAGVEPHAVDWSPPGQTGSLFTDAAPPGDLHEQRVVFANPQFVEAAERVLCHRDAERFSRLYRILCRLQDDRQLLSNPVDDDVMWLRDRDKTIRRDEHKMHAFVRFRKVDEQATASGMRERFGAWFEPQHRIVELTAGFFVRRFTGMDWAILTPDRSAFWIGQDLSFGEGARREDAPQADAIEDQWRSYYAAIFNPARLKVKSMQQHMPKHYWRNLPEARLIPALTAGASARVNEMRSNAVTERNSLADKVRPALPVSPHENGAPALGAMKAAVDGCRRCPLHRDATQGVAGEGPATAQLMIVGEQPGDQEDLAGRAFVGPAGQLLDKALQQAGVEREKVFITNAVKHFKFEPRGKRRIHSKPNASEIDACRWWLDLERQLVQPKVILGLGASAARGLLGQTASIASLRGQDIETGGALVRITVHPSHLLRLPDADAKAREYERFVQDIAAAWKRAEL